MRSAVTPRLVVGVYLAWGMVSCASGDDVPAVIEDSGPAADATPDVPVTPGEDTPTVGPEDVGSTRDVGADAPAVPRDAGAVPDSLPTDSVMFFQGTACPSGWAPYLDGVGRAVAAASNPTLGAYPLGSPMGDREVRGHTHNYSGSFTLDGVSYVGVVGGANAGTSAAATVRFDAQTSLDPAGLPYVQLLVCRKTGPVLPRSQGLPRGMMIFFVGERCPPGFSPPVVTRGRVLVGLPEGGQDGATFGGPPLGAGEPNQHTHPTTTELVTAGHGIALASGCCGSGYARNGTYRVMGRTDANWTGMPTVQLRQCQRD